MAIPYRHANTDTMQAFLDRTASKIKVREHAVMIIDGAGWHRSKDLRWPDRITPLRLPPYSPELNPIERLWLWLRNNHWSNRSYIDEAALIEEVKRSRRQLDRQLIRSVCHVSWIPPAAHP